MADATLQISDRFPVGSPVDAFPVALLGEPREGSPKAPPPGSVPVAAFGTVAADGSLVFTGLLAGAVYAATQGAPRAAVTSLGSNAWLVRVAASGGTFKVLIGANASAAIAYNAAASAVQTAVQAVTGGSGATVTGSPGAWTVTLSGAGTVTVDGSSLTATDPGAGRRYVQFGCATYGAPGRIPHPWVAPS